MKTLWRTIGAGGDRNTQPLDGPSEGHLRAAGPGPSKGHLSRGCGGDEQIEPLTTVIAVVADVSQADDIARAVEDTTKAFGRIDVVFNNAGIMPMARPRRSPKAIGTR